MLDRLCVKGGNLELKELHMLPLFVTLPMYVYTPTLHLHVWSLQKSSTLKASRSNQKAVPMGYNEKKSWYLLFSKYDVTTLAFLPHIKW